MVDREETTRIEGLGIRIEGLRLIDAGLMTARELIDFAQPLIAKRFKDTGVIGPMYHAVTESGTHLVFPAPRAPSKDFSVEIVKAVFQDQRVTAYLYIDEAWILEGGGVTEADLEFCRREGVRNHPNRVEVVAFIAEDHDGSFAARQHIIRPAKGKAKLGPLEISDEGAPAYGRMVNLLPDLKAKPN